jgi:hypothetical protein
MPHSLFVKIRSLTPFPLWEMITRTISTTMKQLPKILILLFIITTVYAEKTMEPNLLTRLQDKPELIAALNGLTDESITSPPEIRKYVATLMSSEDDEVRLFVVRHKRDLAVWYMESSAPPTLKDSSFLAQAILMSALSDQPMPGGEEQTSQRGAIAKLAQKLKESFSISGLTLSHIELTGETHSDVVRWLRTLTMAIENDRSANADQLAVMKRIKALIADQTRPGPEAVHTQSGSASAAKTSPKAQFLLSDKLPEEKSALPTRSEEPTASTSWSLIFVLIVAAIGLLWLLLKGKK